jgi:hypothetical protein
MNPTADLFRRIEGKETRGSKPEAFEERLSSSAFPFSPALAAFPSLSFITSFWESVSHALQFTQAHGELVFDL